MLDEHDNGSQIGLDQGQNLTITLASNPSTGYRWQEVETDTLILKQVGEVEFTPSATGDPPLTGAGGREVFHFKAVGHGSKTLTLAYSRPWEVGVEPLKTFSILVTVR